MSEKTLRTMVTVLGVLVLAWIVASLAGRGGSGGGESDMATFLEALSPDSAQAVVFAGGPDRGDGNAVRLERPPGASGWTVGGHPADSAQVARFLTALDAAEAGAPVSTNPDNHARMEVDDDSARRLILEGSSGADTLLVGKAGPSTGTVYTRLPGRNPVYVVRADLASHAARTEGDWRSRRIAAVDTGTVAVMVVERAADVYRLERGDSAWTVDGVPATGPAVRDILSELNDLLAQRFPTEVSAQVDPSAADRTVHVSDGGGAELLVVRLWTLSDDTGTTVRAVATGRGALQPDTPFTLPSWRADRLAPEVGSLRSDGRGGS